MKVPIAKAHASQNCTAYRHWRHVRATGRARRARFSRDSRFAHVTHEVSPPRDASAESLAARIDAKFAASASPRSAARRV